mgnify:CR=1 FL=1
MLKLLTRFRIKELILMAISIVFIVLQVGLDLRLPEYMSNITVLVQTPGSNIYDILMEGAGMLLCVTCSLITSIIVGYLASHIGAGFSKNLREEMFDKVYSFGMEEIKKFSISSLITRTTNDINHVQRMVSMGLQIGIKAPIMAMWAVSKIIDKNLVLSGLTGIAVLIAVLTMFVTMLIVIPKFKLVQKLTDRINCVSRESLLGIRVIRAYNAEEFQEEKFDDVNIELTKLGKFTGKTMTVIWPLIDLVNYGLTLGIYIIGAILIQRAVLDMKLELFSNIIVFSNYASQVLASFMMLAMTIIMYPRVSVSSKRLFEVLNTKSTIVDGNFDGKNTAVRGKIEFNHVSFKYPDSDNYVLNDISFIANPGETVAIVGSTGCGKSTLIHLIPRFYDVTSGKITIDNIDIKDYTKEGLNSKIGYVPQKAVLMSNTVSENVGYGNKYGKVPSQEQIEKAIEIAQAKSFVMQMSEGYESQIARGGTNVSGGQMQRLQIARAVARDPEIYIFDDSFSALDYKTDAILRKELQQHTDDSTKIIVAQRIGTIRYADKIVVLNNGKIEGCDTHNNLLDNCSLYRSMAEAQLRKEELYNA